MKHIPVLIMVLVYLPLLVWSEGTRELAPNASVDVQGNTTTDIAALHMGNPAFNNFATYGNDDPNSRLYIHVADPASECVFLGFSMGHRNVTSQFPPSVGYQFRVRDPNGDIVFGPVIVDPADANILTWSEASTGPEQIQGPGGYAAWEVTPADLMSAGWSGGGDYYVEFATLTGASDFLIDFWDITVADCSMTTPEEKTGRVWAFNWSIFAINDFGFPNRPFNGAYYVCAPDPDNPAAAFVTRIDFNGSGFRPAAFNIAFNSFGSMNTGDVMADRRSVENLNATQAEYQVFLNDPVDICETGETGEIELTGISRCSPEEFCIQVIASKEGQIDLLLDFDGQDDIYTPGTADVMAAVNITADQIGEPICLDWDGRDGLGNLLAETVGSMIPVLVSYAQGIYHFPVYDAELMTDGFSVEAVRPPAPIPLLYYDDSNITVPSGSGEPAMQLTGCVLPCHRWMNFTNNSVPGFGNLHTINSWWFSQQVIRQALFPLPAYLACDIAGPAQICEGSTALLELTPTPIPTDGTVPEIAEVVWSGPGVVGTATGSTVSVNAPGTYEVDIRWLTGQGDTCQTSCSYTLSTAPLSMGSIDTLIVLGDTIEINDTEYTAGGEFIQVLTAANGCDSILTINIISLQTVVHFNLDDCASNVFEGTNFDYSEFTPEYPQPVSCADIEATILFRANPEMNAHSCTPGVSNSPAICVSSLNDCSYDAGNELSFVFELTVTPAPDTAVAITEFSFFEKAPEMFDWIDGDNGANNYPTLYGMRILKNDVEVYRQEDLPTTQNWTEQVYSLRDEEALVVDQPTTFRFELLGYCLVGNGALVTAWDLDEFNVQASCVSPAVLDGSIAGTIATAWGSKMSGTDVAVLKNGVLLTGTESAPDGSYFLERIRLGTSYELRSSRPGDDLAGVSTLDLLRIQRHLLGIQPLEAPWQYVAADINRSNAISVIDLLQMRKLLLGYYHSFPDNTSWRLGPAAQQLTIENPWSFEESYWIEVLNDDLRNADFMGIKVGDVTGDALSSSVNGQINTRSSDNVQLQLQPVSHQNTELVRIEVTAENFTDIYGFQCEMQFDYGNIVGVEDGLLSINDMYAVEHGTLRIVWTAEMAMTSRKDEVLFTILLSTPFGVQARLIPGMRAEAYKGEHLEVLDLSLGVQKHDKTHASLAFSPNPFTDVTTLHVDLKQAGLATIKLFDASGVMRMTAQVQVHVGKNAIVLDSPELNAYTGMCICTVESGDEIVTGKVFKF